MPDEENPMEDAPAGRLVDPPDGEFWQQAIPETEITPEARAREAVQEQLDQAADKRKRAFLQFNITKTKGIAAQLALLTGQVARLATAVERLLEEAYGVRSVEGELGGEDPEVGYTDQDQYDIDEALEAAKNLEEEGGHD